MHDRARDEDALSLPAGEAAAGLIDDGIHPHGHGVNIGCESDGFGGGPGIGDRQQGSADDVGVDIGRHEFAGLEDDADLPPYGLHV